MKKADLDLCVYSSFPLLIVINPSISFIIQNTLYEEVQPSLISFIIQNTLYEDNLMISHIFLKLLFKKKSNDFYIQCWWPSWILNYLKQEQTAYN
jgi:hypothetical protein